MTLAEFAAKWAKAAVTERAGAQEHFLDLCALLGQPAPATADPSGERFAFEKGVAKLGGGAGFADVWRRDHFAWEYKGKKKDLDAAYVQLGAYHEALGNPPLLIVCDLNRFEVHLKVTNLPPTVYAFDLHDLAANVPTPACPVAPLDVLRAAFEDPTRLYPTRTPEQVTEEVAKEFARLARSLTGRGHDPAAVARFLIRLLFCLFAEDVGLLPAGILTDAIAALKGNPDYFARSLTALFAAMRDGGPYGPALIRRFNGGLFEERPLPPAPSPADGEGGAYGMAVSPSLEAPRSGEPDVSQAPPSPSAGEGAGGRGLLTAADLEILHRVAKKDWKRIEPSIFGTLFERSLDPVKRSRLGAHYTSRADIETLVEPVLMPPLLRRWDEVRAVAEVQVEKKRGAQAEQQAKGANVTPQERRALADAIASADRQIARHLDEFTTDLASVRVLDPACGSGNFLYIALRYLLDLENRVIQFAVRAGLTGFFPKVGPEQMRGIELNEYAHELAPVTIWIGYIQWLRDNV